MNNRPIKFRTWDTQNEEFSEWTNRDPFFSTSHGQIFFWERVRKEDGSFDGDIIIQDHGGRFILQQFTGLTDSTGKEIYEGDIFKGGTCKWDAVEFQDGKFVANLRGARLFDLCELFDGDWNRKPEIAGNMFENLELLA